MMDDLALCIQTAVARISAIAIDACQLQRTVSIRLAAVILFGLHYNGGHSA